MPVSKHAFITLLLAGAVFITLIVFVYLYYISPTGMKAHRSSDIVALSKSEKASYTSLDGNEIELLNDSDVPLIVTVWASWSPYTPADFLVLKNIKQSFGDKIRIVALNRMEPKETAQAFLETIDPIEGVEHILDEEDFFFKTVGGYAMPETLLFDIVGNIQYHKRGILEESELLSALNALLTQNE